VLAGDAAAGGRASSARRGGRFHAPVGNQYVFMLHWMPEYAEVPHTGTNGVGVGKN
jgi:hypothetical protein